MNKDIAKKYQDIKKNIEQLSAQLAEITEMANDQLHEYGEDAIDEVILNVDKAVDLAKQKTKAAKDLVSENPWTTVAVASLAVITLGCLFSHSKCKQK